MDFLHNDDDSGKQWLVTIEIFETWTKYLQVVQTRSDKWGCGRIIIRLDENFAQTAC